MGGIEREKKTICFYNFLIIYQLLTNMEKKWLLLIFTGKSGLYSIYIYIYGLYTVQKENNYQIFVNSIYYKVCTVVLAYTVILKSL